MQLNQRTMLVNFSVSQWTARRLDRKVTADVAVQNKASQDAGRYNKLLVAAESLKTIQKAVNAARTYHYANTLPWCDNGARILPSAHYVEYSGNMRKHRQVFEQAVKDFIGSYPQLRADAVARLGDMYKPDDYPTVQDIENRFGWRVEVMPLPDGSDFRVDLADDIVAKLQRKITDRTTAATHAAMRDLWNRLSTAVKHMADKLQNADAVFRDSLVTNLCDLVALLPKLNITNDPELERTRRDIEALLCTHAPTTLREDKDTRTEVAKNADEILQAMGAYMGSV